MLSSLVAALPLLGASYGAYLEKRPDTRTTTSSTTSVPQYFQTTPEIYAGMTAMQS